MNVPDFVQAKQNGQKLAVLTAYDYPWAKIVDEAGIDAILVGDTLGMVIQGHDSTLPVTLDQMIYHGSMVTRAAKRAMVIVDMPFLSYHVSAEKAVENAGRILKETNATAVKLEGGQNQAETIARLTTAEIPVMAHIGFKPQSVRHEGRMGRIKSDEQALLQDALAAQNAGAFAVVLEMVKADLAAKITTELSIPTIGIGSGSSCDGQVLVLNDMLGMNPEFQPKFLKCFAQLHEHATLGINQYVQEVREGNYPGPEHSR